MPTDLRRARELFLHAVGKLPPEQWEDYVAEACGGDADLAQQVGCLLQVHREAGSFLDAPALGLEHPWINTAQYPRLCEGPGTVIGPYKLLQQIGEGGMGVVFMAEQTQPIQRTVAVKIIKPGMDTRQVIARFEAERQAVAMMDHPNIAKVLDAGATDSGRPYFVMELVKGVPITKYCDEKHLPLRERLELFIQVCQAVQHAHQKGIIHRDIKPNNVLAAEYDHQTVPKVIDFGVAKATAQKLTERTMFTEFGQVLGTMEYMSPEQSKFNQLDIDTRSDIYSLGVLLYELLAGSTPFEGKRLHAAAFDEMLRIIREEEPPKPSTRLSSSDALASIAANRGLEPLKLNRLVRGELDWIAMKCLEKDRNRRFETANALAVDLRRYLDDEPVEAKPATQLYRLRKFMRRNKVAFAATLVIFAALFTGMSVATWGLVEARRGRVFAERAQHDLQGANEQLATQLSRAAAAEKLASTQASQLAEQLYDIKLPRAVAAVSGGQLAIARENLNQCPPAKRGWEWQWLARQVNLSLPTMIRGRQLAQFTPDGNQIVAVDGVDEKSVKIWNASNGIEERTLARGDKLIKQILMDRDGQRLATGLEDGKVTLWDIPSGRQLWSVKAHKARSDGFAFCTDGSRLVSVSWDGTLKVLDTSNGKTLVSAHSDHELRGACFSPDGKQIVTAGRKKLSAQPTPACVWNAETGELIRDLAGNAPRCATFSVDGRWIATGNHDGIVRVYDAHTGNPIRTMLGPQDVISAIAFDPSGERLATSGGDATVRVWDVDTGKLIASNRDHAAEVNFVSFRHDGQRIVSSDNSGTLHIWDLAAVESFTIVPVDSVPARPSAVGSVAFSPDGKYLLSGTNLGEVKLFDTAKFEEERDLPLFDCREVAFSPDGSQFAASGNGAIAIWNASTGELIRQLSGHQGWVDFLAYSHDSSQLVSSGFDETIRLWNVKSGAPLHVLQSERTGGTIWQAVFRPNGKQIASVGAAGLRIWDARSGALLQAHKSNEGAGLTSVTYSPDGSRVVAGGKDRLLHVWDANTGEQLPDFSGDHAGIVSGLAFSPDGSRLVSSDGSGMVRMWNTQTGLPLITLRESDGDVVSSLAFSPDGNTLAAAVYDGTMVVWELKPPPDGYEPRRIARIASRVATESLEKHDWSNEAFATIRDDASLTAVVKSLASRLAQDRLAVVPELAHRRSDWFRFIANTPEAGASELNDHAWELLHIIPVRMRDPAGALQVAQKAVELSGGKDPRILDTLAIAYGANGKPDKAAEEEQKALELLPPDAPNRSINIQRLKQFRAAAHSGNNRESTEK